MIITPPQTENELIHRAENLSGLSLTALAEKLQTPIPKLKSAKGFIGQLLEKALGADAQNLSEPDFRQLGIELKTLPVNEKGLSCESTYICTAPIPPYPETWETSRVWRKMQRILWMPITASKNLRPEEIIIGTPLLWSPPLTIAQQLQQDWQELTELMRLGRFDELSAHRGQYLQIRPKAANAKTLIQVTDEEGQPRYIVPKGFYLRTQVTRMLLKTYFISA